ncbi:hypothetical protein B484DRAFT_394294 [Ochromonadaceae sp. CCMP2298]|nr:hypothetical protein B484DRAFT_394294 [Ochromonadaceae sp. CCMP2298]
MWCVAGLVVVAEFFSECGITELLDSAMKGYRSCAFAFGQTGAGKTFTMVGAQKGVSASNREKVRKVGV